MIKTAGQPIVNLITGQKVMEERLCRPYCTIKEWFSSKDKNALVRRELHSILQCIEESNGYPYNINVTAHTLPILTRIPVTWNGGIEIVEWEMSQSPHFKVLSKAIHDLQNRGLTIWADDVTADAIEMWLRAGVNGFKVELNAIKQDASMIEQLKQTKKPIIVEKIETAEDDLFLKEHQFLLAQGFYYGRPETFNYPNAVNA